MSELEAIVRDLVAEQGKLWGYYGHCIFCGLDGDDLKPHAESCIQRRAIEWVAAYVPDTPAAGIVCGECGRVTDERGGCACVTESYWPGNNESAPRE